MGSTAINPKIDEVSFQAFAYPGRRPRNDLHLPLTAMQEKVANLKKENWKVSQIAKRLGIPIESVRNHLHQIAVKGLRL